jgi:ribosomal protein L11 methyltransferase
MDHIELTIDIVPRNPFAEILVAQLADEGFDSFVDTETGIIAYGPDNQIDVKIIDQLPALFAKEATYTFHHNVIPHQNWNALWEADFDPVFVEDKLSILAPFHDKKLGKGLIIEIQPQTSFGTGHHQTTWLVSRAMFDLKMPEKVLDMGSGTGVLAILAEKLGAKEVLAVDIEPWSAENAIENGQRNNCKALTSVCGDVDLIEGKSFGLILANINKNILKAHMESYSNALASGGNIILSGFFTTDVPELVTFCENLALIHCQTFEREGWAAIQFSKA